MFHRPIVIVLTPLLILAAQLVTANFIFHGPALTVSHQMAAIRPVPFRLGKAACRLTTELAG